MPGITKKHTGYQNLLLFDMPMLGEKGRHQAVGNLGRNREWILGGQRSTDKQSNDSLHEIGAWEN